MIQARSKLTGELVLAAPGRDATCPQCHAPVRSKCGEQVAHHFAHIAADDCDTWSEGESQWHQSWKLLVPEDRREVVIGDHRADIVASDGAVVELQHSAISPETIRQREAHYGPNMVWIFDVSDCRSSDDERILFTSKRSQSDPAYRTFRWRWPRKHIAEPRARRLLDSGKPYLLDLLILHTDTPAYGAGRLVSRRDFIEWLNKPHQQTLGIQ